MATLSGLLLLIVAFVGAYASRTYDITVKVTSDLCACFPGSPSPMYMRICNGAECSNFLSIPEGMPKGGRTYSFEIETNTDIGTIDKMQIVNMGDNSLCLDEVTVDDITWDWSNWWWTPTGTTKCFERSKSNGCSTMTITGSNDDLWTDKATSPCEFASILENTYSPTTSPTTSPQSCQDQFDAETGIEFTFWEKLKCECTNHIKLSIGVIAGIMLFVIMIGYILYRKKHRNGTMEDEENEEYNLMHDDNENSVQMSQISVNYEKE